MLSSFNKPPKVFTTAKPRKDETYNLKGLNMVAPDQVMPVGESPYTINSRGYATEDGETRVAIRTRKGSQLLSTPIGETASTANTATSTGDLAFTADSWVLQPFIPNADGRLTKLELHVKSGSSNGGHILVDIYTDVSGFPGTLLAQGSILSSSVSASYQYLPAYFIDAPLLTNGTTYWVMVRVQDLGIGTYNLNQTATAGALRTLDAMASYSSLGVTFRYKSYLSTDGSIIGFARRYPSDGTNRTYFAFNSHLYEVTDAGIATSIDSSIDASATFVRFAQVNDKLIFIDGFGAAKWYDGSSVTNIGGVSGVPVLTTIFQNRALFVPKDDPTRVNFSSLLDFETYDAVNFFYVPSPKSPDHIAGWRVFQEKLVIFTHETKHIITGSDISSFTRQEAVGTKGAVSDEAIAADRNNLYFMADDGMVYAYNGASDTLISTRVQPELSSIQDKTKVRMHIYKNQLRIYYPKSPSSTVDHMLLYDIESKDWFMDTGRPVVGSLEWYLNDNQLIEFSALTGQMFLGETTGADLGKSINFKYWTAYNAYGSGAAKDRVKRFRPIIRPASQPYYLQVGKDIDFQDNTVMHNYLVDAGGLKWGQGGIVKWGAGGSVIWGGGKKQIDNASPMSGRGKHTQYRFEQLGVETPVELYGYISLIKSGNSR